MAIYKHYTRIYFIIKLIKKQDPESNVSYYEATGKIVGNISEIVLITWFVLGEDSLKIVS